MRLLDHLTEKTVVPANQLSKFLASPEAAPFFEEDNLIIGCIDGRVMPEGVLGLAGSGILLPRDPDNNALPDKKYMDILVKMVKEGKLTTLTWHRGHGGCGAAKLYLKNIGVEGLREEDVGKVAKEFVQNLVAELNKRQTEVTVKAEEASAEGHHGEKGVYVDLTNRLDLKPERMPDLELPNGFTVNPRLTNDLEYATIEIGVAIDIAFSHDKDGKTFTAENPFFIYILDFPGNPLSLEGFPEMIRKMVSEKPPEFKNRIKIETVNVKV